MRHVRVGDQRCEPCNNAYKDAHSGWVHRPRQRTINHGTAAGARAHQYRHEPACGDCARAYRAYQRDARARRKQQAA
jgi:hypothetical protein